MEYRLQLSPPSDVRKSQLKLRSVASQGRPQAFWQDAKLFRSWLYYDFEDLNDTCASWNGVLGLGIAVVFSVAFWTGVALLVSRLWK